MSKNNTNEPEADYYLGVDVAKSKLDVSVLESRSSRELRHTVIANTTEAIGTLLEDCLASYSGSLQCAVEATGTYHFNLLYAAEALGVAGTQPDDLLNPLTASDEYLRKLLLSITPPWRAD